MSLSLWCICLAGIIVVSIAEVLMRQLMEYSVQSLDSFFFFLFFCFFTQWKTIACAFIYNGRRYGRGEKHLKLVYFALMTLLKVLRMQNWAKITVWSMGTSLIEKKLTIHTCVYRKKLTYSCNSRLLHNKEVLSSHRVRGEEGREIII